MAGSGLGWGPAKSLETSQGRIQRFHEASEMEAPFVLPSFGAYLVAFTPHSRTVVLNL